MRVVQRVERPGQERPGRGLFTTYHRWDENDLALPQQQLAPIGWSCVRALPNGFRVTEIRPKHVRRYDVHFAFHRHDFTS
jgi:hypothetical protein